MAIDLASQQQIYISGSGEQAHAIFASGYNTPYSYQKSDYAGVGQQALAVLQGKKDWMQTFIDRGSTSDYNRVKAEYDALGGDTAYQQLKSGQYSTDLISKIFPSLDRTQLNQFAAGQPVSSGYVTDPKTGNLTTQAALDKAAYLEAQFAAGKMRKVPVGNGFGYVPVGSAADYNLQGMSYEDQLKQPSVQQQIREQGLTPQAPQQPAPTGGLPMPSGYSASTPTSGGSTTGGTTTSSGGLQMDYSQILGDIYEQRPDLQALYGPDGRAINPNDPKVAGIPTILDWAKNFGVKEYPTLQGFTGSVTGGSSGGTGSTGKFNTGDPNTDALLQEIYDKFQGQQLNPDIEITPELAKQFLDEASKRVSPYYTSRIDLIRDDLNRNLDQLQSSYDLQKQQDESQFKQNLGAKRESLAGAGLAFSGNRGAAEQSMVEGQNRQLKANAQAAAGKAAEAISGVEAKIGSRNLAGLNMPNMVEYSANNTGMGGFGTGRTLDFGAKGGITGDLEYQRNEDQDRINQALRGQWIDQVSRTGNRTLNFN